jgi:hypothetical protein
MPKVESREPRAGPVGPEAVIKYARADFGYRWLDTDDTSGASEMLFKYDAPTQGPNMGFVLRA